VPVLNVICAFVQNGGKENARGGSENLPAAAAKESVAEKPAAKEKKGMFSGLGMGGPAMRVTKAGGQ